MVFLLPQAVDQAAERFPEREAVCFQNKSLSYTDLATRSNQLAHVLLEEGVKKGDRVGIYMNKSLECVIALYGIMKAGAAYVPLDPAAPLSRLAYVIHDCDIRYLVSQPQKKEKVNEIVKMLAAPSLECVIGLPIHTKPPPNLKLGRQRRSQVEGLGVEAKARYRGVSWQEVFDTPLTNTPDVGTTEQDLAYILYTSGSTGHPKGIMHTHRSGLSFARWAKQTYGLQHGDHVSNHAPLHFDLSTFDFFATALAGATTVIIPEAYKKLPASLSKLIADKRVSVWYSVPFALTQLLLRGALHARDLSTLRWVLFAGEAFPPKYLYQLMQRLPNARFSNLYGPTETNVCTYYHVPSHLAQLADPDEPLPIGKVCEHAEALVVDGKNQPVPRGEVGELLIRGPLVMRGYWKRAGQTYDDETRFYRTGDLVQELTCPPHPSEGNFKFLGRKDRQIKTRGYRVELDEVEVALLAHPKVEEGAVFTVPDGQGSQHIEAVVTLKQEASQPHQKAQEVEALSPSELKKYVAISLPSYAVPANIHLIEHLPRTSTGKIDRQKIQKDVIKHKGND